MAAKESKSEIPVEHLELGEEIIGAMAALRPFQSLSFALSEDGAAALAEMVGLTKKRMGKNMPKLREAALGVLTPLTSHSAGTPINVNLTDYEVKAMTEVLALIQRNLKK